MRLRVPKIKIPVTARDLCLRVKFRRNGPVVRAIRGMIGAQNRFSLDFGCGTGRLSYLFDAGSYVGVDIDPDRLHYAAKTHSKRSFVRVGHGPLPFKDQCFSLVLATAVLHHLSDDDVLYYAEELKRVLKPEGIMVILEPVYRPDAPIRNFYMSVCDRGRYIRSLSGYVDLLKSRFEVHSHLQYGAENLYYNVLLSGRPRFG